ncbi:MAG: hypothetical protein AVDCRST_MAG23-1308 [uncultured Sphingosinicella sp.]|uniref:Uncharacterized protein n=1 Tax=uncultured Sphingosinicella sp. TaxID=478748 RepID=A0A6J4TZ75_9SPHN|nr:MAG: hypothetical protein AVDCRST_MAG23-1308 [uncultured Sphingosinicella sp.]
MRAALEITNAKAAKCDAGIAIARHSFVSLVHVREPLRFPLL